VRVQARGGAVQLLNSGDPPQLESAWFRPLSLKCDLTVSNLCAFKRNLYRYIVEIDGTARIKLSQDVEKVTIPGWGCTS
jgi:hypothetical protein